MKTICIGTTFRWTYADGNPLWKVTKPLGKAVWEAVSQPEPVEIDGRVFEGDYAGIRKSFLATEIAQALAGDAFWNKVSRDHEGWVEGLVLGSIVHQRNHRDSYIRCQVVQGKQGKEFLPLALVGNWQKYDLPQRYPTGEIHYGYHAEKVLKKESYTVNASHFWEYQPFPKDIDPRGMKAVSLEVPPMTFEEERTAHMWAQVNAIRKATERVGEETPEDILKRLGALVGHNLIVPAGASFKPSPAALAAERAKT